MTMAEFNAWLEGFEEAIDGTPTKAQWKKIRAKLDTVMPGSVWMTSYTGDTISWSGPVELAN